MAYTAAGKRVLSTGASPGLGAALGGDEFEHYVPDTQEVVDAANAGLRAPR
ncbi:MAG TPA: hypothetical protein VFI55_11430 [Mycobacterium sp.]|nr:hypothetical protein [Mycobacterium sp.]